MTGPMCACSHPAADHSGCLIGWGLGSLAPGAGGCECSYFQEVHPDAGNEDRNHYDWFMPDNPAAAVDVYLDDFEAKMREALTDPFVHDMAHSVLPLITAYREAREKGT